MANRTANITAEESVTKENCDCYLPSCVNLQVMYLRVLY